MNVDHLSLSTTPVLLLKDNEVVSQGTGFYYVHKFEDSEVLFLVTNHHVLTGSPPTENKPPIGDKIAIQFHKSADESGIIETKWFPLYTKDGHQIWFNCTEAPEADLGVIPIPVNLCRGCKIWGISEDWTKSSLRLRPGTSVTLIGYPYGYYDTKNSLPIWKTGNIASEPHVDFEGKPYFIVDVSAFPGMSGSPVFAISHGAFEMEGGGASIGAGVMRRFLGIYASMQMLEKNMYLEELAHISSYGIKNTESLELGNVWKANLIIQTINEINISKYKKEIIANLDS
jgi:hypothetical protein